MFRVPHYLIFVFVGLSIGTAFLINQFQTKTEASLGSNKVSISTSGNENSISSGVNEMVSNGLNSRSIASSEAPETLYRDSQLSSPYFRFEESKSCGIDRNYFEVGLARIPSVYRDERARSPAEFPRHCMTYILRKFLEGSEAKSHSLFGLCENSEGVPLRGAVKPCVTVNYVNSIYNSFGDFTTCFGVPQRDFLPQIYSESGFHMNALGVDFEVGTGQLSSSSIEYANSRFFEFKSQLLSSENEACRKLATIVKDIRPVSENLSKRCELILPPENPMLNIFYLMIKYKQDREKIEASLEDPEFHILKNLDELGLDEKSYDREQLIQMMVTLSTSAGVRGAAILFKEYLDLAKSTRKALTLADFNFGNESLIYLKIKKETGILTRNAEDTELQWSENFNKFEILKNKLEQMNLKFKPKIESIAIKGTSGLTYKTYKVSWQKSELTFPAYLMIYQRISGAGYLSFVKHAANELSEIIKGGACVPDSYLSL